jgi:hypothetical protein
MRLAYGLSALLLFVADAGAEGVCHVLDVDFTAAESSLEETMRFPLQMVAWLETPGGQFVDTVLITREVGTFGLGNRPGRFDFGSAPLWPYGRRTTVFPVWARRHGIEFPEIVFQNGSESTLSHPFTQSSPDAHYCTPMARKDNAWDTASCASPTGSDKGMFGPGISHYPPRADVSRQQYDTPSVEMFDLLNPFDVVTMATPAASTPTRVTYTLPEAVPQGDYVLFVEVAREFDHNATYTAAARPKPSTGVDFTALGLAYQGQPAVIYKVPITVSSTEQVASTTDYVGYSDPDGLDGTVRPPDNTIDTTVPGSGALRLQLVPDAAGAYRVKVRSRVENDAVPPTAPADLAVAAVSGNSVTLTFVAPGDDAGVGRIRTYEVRYRVGEPITAENFEASPQLAANVPLHDGGTPTTVVLEQLLPETSYSVGIRAVDDCRNRGELAIITFETAARQNGSVDACFIATAAYGSAMANDVERLRGFRDSVLRQTVLGELAVEAYYTFGPAFAGVIGESELLRSTARSALRPVVDKVQHRTGKAATSVQ